ncbi:hypothetical protein [Nocardia sp. NPDC004260]
MTVALTDIRIATDRSHVSAVSVGGGGWVIEQLRGRTFTQPQALGVVQFANVVGEGLDLHPVDDPIWREAMSWLRCVGLSIREAVCLLDLPCDPGDLPSDLMLAERVVNLVDGRRSPVQTVVVALTRWLR